MPSIETTINQRTLEETADEVTPDFPYRADCCDLRELPGGSFPWHWHGEIELFYVQQGAMDYQLPSGVYRFAEGDAGFVNANVLHATQAVLDLPALQIEHLFLPGLISGERGSAMETKYVYPLLTNRSAELLRFPAKAECTARMRALMDEAFQLYEDLPFGAELRIRSLMSELWLLALSQAPAEQRKGGAADDERIKRMMTYLSAHYGEKIELEDIAAAAHIGRRECCRCFKRQLNLSPFEYLISLRISKACEMLLGGRDSIAEIAERCGFASASYFGKLFREKTGCTPGQYRSRKDAADD
ncbi:MAG: AraC family transcriptional regulator [Eubacteriales bacterium]|nr:AraC family transcriptional regulator [Eubacteriales bacterium]